jgi:hypothetical protein
MIDLQVGQIQQTLLSVLPDLLYLWLLWFLEDLLFLWLLGFLLLL